MHRQHVQSHLERAGVRIVIVVHEEAVVDAFLDFQPHGDGRQAGHVVGDFVGRHAQQQGGADGVHAVLERGLVRERNGQRERPAIELDFDFPSVLSHGALDDAHLGLRLGTPADRAG